MYQNSKVQSICTHIYGGLRLCYYMSYMYIYVQCTYVGSKDLMNASTTCEGAPTVRLFWRPLGDIRGFGLGAVKGQELFPPVPANHTNTTERCKNRANHFWFAPFLIQRRKRGRAIHSKHILFEGFWRFKIVDETLLQVTRRHICIGNSPHHEHS